MGFVYLPYKEIKVMKNIITHLLAAVGSFGIAVGLMQGFIQQFISFADPINEMAMCVLMLMMGTVFTGIAVSEIKEKLQS
jgi:hypothetical protein